MDNAPYHSRRQEKIPSANWKKADIQQWLRGKNVNFENTDIKLDLMNKVRSVKEKFKIYAVDELAKKSGIELLRLPPYHCELNPIELVWADVKGHVARNNTTFKFENVKNLLKEAIDRVTPLRWQKSIEHTIKEEEKFYKIDFTIDEVADSFIINVTDSETSESEVFSESEVSE